LTHETSYKSAASGLVSRASPVQTALRNYTGDEGRSFEFDNQVLISSHRKLLWSKARVVNVAEKSGRDPVRHGRERRAQANHCRSVESCLDDVRTEGWPDLRDQLGRCLRRPKRHPACRWRDSRPGSCMERENLCGDVKGNSSSGYNREAKSTDAPDRGGLLRSSDEAG
jgi:hypothetical protein